MRITEGKPRFEISMDFLSKFLGFFVFVTIFAGPQLCEYFVDFNF